MTNYITLIFILVLIYLLFYFNYLNFFNKKENFRGGASAGTSRGSGGFSSGTSRGSGGFTTGHNIGGRGTDLGGKTSMGLYSGNSIPLNSGKNNFNNAAYTLQSTEPDLHVTHNKVDNAKDYPKIVKNNMPNYNKLLGDDNKRVKYYYNDVIDQSKISENAYDLVNQIDLIDYANIKTGLEKCEAECDGVCFELGYMGTATCFPKETKTFDYGSIYKNPTFIYG